MMGRELRVRVSLPRLDPPARQCHMAAMPADVKRICVYCGSDEGVDPRYREAADELGRRLVKAGIGLVYGGGGLGLMGIVARSVLRDGGRVTGIIPNFLTSREHLLNDVQDLIVTASMHERKQLMFEHSDAFVALPGGIGTLDELVEQLTWAQLGRHSKPIVLANIGAFWNPLLALIDHMREEAFIGTGLNVHLDVAGTAGEIIPAVLALAAKAKRREPDGTVASKF